MKQGIENPFQFVLTKKKCSFYEINHITKSSLITYIKHNINKLKTRVMAEEIFVFCLKDQHLMLL